MGQGSLLCCGLWFTSKLSTAPAWDTAAGALAGEMGRGSACCQGVVGWDITLGPVRTLALQRWRWGSKAAGTRLRSEVPEDCFLRSITSEERFLCIQGLPNPDFLQSCSGALDCTRFAAQQPPAISTWTAAPDFALRRRGLRRTESGYRIGWRHSIPGAYPHPT